MPLLGWPLVVTLAIVAVVAVAGTLVLWGRVQGPSPARAAQRVAMLVACQVTAVLVVAAGINNYGYFYGSWSELLGQQSGSTPVVHGTGVVASGPTWRPRVRLSIAPETIGPAAVVAAAWSRPSQWSTRGRIEAVQVQGARSGISEPVLVYLPPQYFQPRYARTQFPGVEVMTGYPGTTTALVDRMGYADVLLKQIAGHRARPMVLVMLRPTVAPPRDTECTDVPGGPLALTDLAMDVPAAIDHAFRVRPTGWGAMGDSTGGYCAVKLALLHSDVFTAAVALSGYYHTLHDYTTGDLWGGSSVLRNLNNPEWLLAHQPQPPVSLLLTVGTAERGPNGVRDTRRFLHLVRPPLKADSIFVPQGGHNFADWLALMPTSLDWLSRHLA